MSNAVACGCKGGYEKRADLLKLIDDHKDIPGALIAVLHDAQIMFGYLPKEVIYDISKGLKIPISEVMGIITFYSLFSTEPKGKYDISVCMGTACYVKGAERVLESFKEQLGIEVGGTTDDMLFSLSPSRCIGACGLAPVVGISGKIHREVTAKQVPAIVAEYRKKEGVEPT